MAEDPGALHQAIEQTRSELGETIEALGHKADVKSRATEKIDEGGRQVRMAAERAVAEAEPVLSRATQKARSLSSQLPPWATDKPAVYAAAAVFVLLMVIQRRRRGH